MAENRPFSGKSIAHAIAVWVAFFALYLLFTGSGTPAELVVGGVCSGLVAAFEMALRACSERALGVSPHTLYPLLPALGQLVLDIFRVAGALCAALYAPRPGGFREIPMPAGVVADTPAGRGVAIAAVSLAPDSFVVGAGAERGRLVVHRLVG